MDLLQFANKLENEHHTISVNHEVLREDYIPETIAHRKRELEMLANKVYAMPLVSKPGTHLFIFGKPGTGKSLTNQYLIKQLADQGRAKELPIKVMYINCADYSTSRAVFKYIYDQVSDRPIINTDSSGFYHGFLNEIDGVYSNITIVLDEVDKITRPKDMDRMLYMLLRYRECHQLNNNNSLWITLVAISNDMLLKEKLAKGTQSSFGINWLHYQRYTQDQLFAILKHRSDKAFKKGIVAPELLQKIAKYLHENGGDARQGISILKNMGALAESSTSKELTISHFERALEIIEERSIKAELINLSKQEQYVYYAFTCAYLNAKDKTKDKCTTIGDIYLAYKAITDLFKVSQVTERQVRRYLDQFDSKTNLLRKIMIRGVNFYSPTFDSDIAFNIWQEFQGEKKEEMNKYFKRLLSERDIMESKPIIET